MRCLWASARIKVGLRLNNKKRVYLIVRCFELLKLANYNKTRLQTTSLELIPYPLWQGAKIVLDLIDGTRNLIKNIKVTWDDQKTLVSKATLVISVKFESVYGTTEMAVFANGNEVDRKRCEILSEVYNNRIDVTNQIYNASNTFEVTYGKNAIINPSATLTVSATLEIEYSGDSPDPPPILPDWWPYAVAGGVLTVAVAYAWRRRQKARSAQYRRGHKR